MTTATIPSADLASSVPPFLTDVFAAVDRMDAEGYANFFAPDADWKFGNADLLQGRPAIAATAQSVFDLLTSIGHSLKQVYHTPTGYITQGDVTYQRKDGKVLVLPFSAFFTIEDNQITHYQTFMDGSPLFADLGERETSS